MSEAKINSQTHTIFRSIHHNWETPSELFKSLDNEFQFTLDVCAIPISAKCKRYFTPDQDGLKQKWEGACWMNPPYGKNVSQWLKKAWESSLEGATVVCLLPCRTDTRWFHDWVLGKASIRFIQGRLHFSSFNGKGNGHGQQAPFASIVLIYDQGLALTYSKMKRK